MLLSVLSVLRYSTINTLISSTMSNTQDTRTDSNLQADKSLSDGAQCD